MDSFPLVSIVTPSLNQGNYIMDNISSIKNQNYTNIEHLVIDGGSCDETLSILKKEEKKYNLKWISEKDSGQSEAINKGFKMLTGDIVGWLNADDVYFYKDTISYIVQTFKEMPQTDVIYGDMVSINEKNEFVSMITTPQFNGKKLSYKCYIPQPSVFFRKKVINKYFIDNTLNYAMDYDYWLKLYNNNVRFHHVKKILSSNRIHGSMKTLNGSNEMARETKYVQVKYGQKIDLMYFLNNKLNLVDYGIRRIYSIFILKQIRDCYYGGDIAFPIKLDPMYKMYFNQLFYRM